MPRSINLQQLNNKRKFILTGRKGTGKTYTQLVLSNEAEAKGYFTHQFRFFDDMRPQDYSKVVSTQTSTSYTSTKSDKDYFLHYDFRDVWEAFFFKRIAIELSNRNITNAFTKFALPEKGIFTSIFEGISKTTTLKFSAEMNDAAVELNIDPSGLLKKDEIHISDFNSICRKMYNKSCKEHRFYFFADELIFSRLDLKPDELTVRAAMVRDIIRTAWNLNKYAATNELDLHLICSLRPEVRNAINEMDPESGKYLDGKDVELNWMQRPSDDSNLIMEVLKKKIEHSLEERSTIFEDFANVNISFGNTNLSFSEFISNNTWGRPRDVVRLLLAIQKKNPDSTNITEREIKSSLDEYSRTSFKELIDELGVKFGPAIGNAIKTKVRKPIFRSADELWSAIQSDLKFATKESVIKELFEIGVIGGFNDKSRQYYWAHRGETYLKPEHRVIIHFGLRNELSIR